MGLIAPQDAAFLIGESREHPMHVGVLMLFERPPGAGPEFVSEMYRDLLRHTDIRRWMRRRPQDPVGTVGQLWWTEDQNIDLEYHVRFSALPTPGRVRELLELTSRVHGTLLDRHRPLWEFHLIEGLADGRFAAYAKMHHALVDGVAGLRLLSSSLSEDPDEVCPPYWAARPSRSRPRTKANSPTDLLNGVLGQVRSAASAVREIATMTPSMVRLASDTVRGRTDVPFPAPRTMFNVPITGARRFAAQSWQIDRMVKAGTESGATLNDIVLAMCAGALRRYLLDHDALPDKPLVAAVPVSLALRTGQHGSEGGNAIGAVLCNLATDVADPHQRLEIIRTSMNNAKESMSTLSPTQILGQTVLQLSGSLLQIAVPGAASVAPPTFNLFISNVPGPRVPLYWSGARLDGFYPVSIPAEGQALNITTTSYAGEMQFGLTGCRRTVPHLQRLLTYLEESLAELESPA